MRRQPTADAGAISLPLLVIYLLLGFIMGSIVYSIYLRSKRAPPEPAQDECGSVEPGSKPEVTSPSRVAKMSAGTEAKFEKLGQVDHEEDG